MAEFINYCAQKSSTENLKVKPKFRQTKMFISTG